MSGTYYVFIPFTPSEMDRGRLNEKELTPLGIADTWKKNAVSLPASRKVPRIIEFEVSGPEKLKKFDPVNDTVYIIGHCTAGGDGLKSSRERFAERVDLSPELVVSRLRMHFPATTANFKLYACFGGMDSYSEAKQRQLTSYGSRLHTALKDQFPAAKLTAYKAAVSPHFSGDHRTATAYKPGTYDLQKETERPSASSVRFR